MARVIALTQAPIWLAPFGLARSLIVNGCAFALIAAGNALPF